MLDASWHRRDLLLLNKWGSGAVERNMRFILMRLAWTEHHCSISPAIWILYSIPINIYASEQLSAEVRGPVMEPKYAV